MIGLMDPQARRLLLFATGMIVAALAIGGLGKVVVDAVSRTHSMAPTAQESLASQAQQNIPRWIMDEHLPPESLPGVHLFAVAGCTACHTYDGAGGSNLGAPDLTAIGSRNLGIRFQINHLVCPSCVNPGSPMPSFKSLGAERVRQLAVFLESSKGIH